MLISTLALLVLSGAPMQDDSAAEADLRSPIASTSPSRTISARPPTVTNGPTRTVTTIFQGHYSRFVDMQH